MGTRFPCAEAHIAYKPPTLGSDSCEACRRGDVRAVQSLISVHNVDINHVDKFDYPPLTLASLCGHYEVVLLLLESGARLERDTFAGER